MSDSEKQGMGCFAKGCLTLVVVFILMVAIGLGGAYYYFNKLVDNLTSDKPIAIKVEQPTDTQMQAAAAKAQALSDAFRSGKEVTVELTGPDLNALIARNAELAEYRGTMYFAIANNELSADVSLPLKAIPFDKLKNRYLNGRLVTFFEWNNGELTVRPKLIEANGNSVPDAILAQVNKGVGDELKKPNGKKMRDELARFKSIRVVGDRLVITTRAGAPATK